MSIEWKYKKSSVSQADIDLYEKMTGFKIPSDYVKILLNYNGSRPKPNKFNTEKSIDRVIKSLISINKGDEGNIYSVLEWVRDRLPRKLVPFAEDPAGNYLCFDFSSPKPCVVFWNIETGQIEYISKNLKDLLEKLY